MTGSEIPLEAAFRFFLGGGLPGAGRAGAGGKATDEEVELEEEDSARCRVGAVEAATPEVAANPADKITDRLSASVRAEYTARIVSRSAHPPRAWMTSSGILAVLRNQWVPPMRNERVPIAEEAK